MAVTRPDFGNSIVHDRTLTSLQKKDVFEEIQSVGLYPQEFSWKEIPSSDHTRPDVKVLKLEHSSSYFFIFNSTRKGELFFSRSPGLDSRVEEGTNLNWADQLLSARIWLEVLKKEIEAAGGEDPTFADAYDLSLYPKQMFLRDLASRSTSSEKTGEPLALIMMDLDKFKPINDSHGHPAGDEVLQSVADSIRQITRGKGSCYRFGGDEFSILLPNYSEDEAASFAERIRRQIELSIIGSKGLRVTASFGVAVAPTHATSADELLKKADAALYEAKEFHGNLVRISGESRPSTDGPRITLRRAPDPIRMSEAEAEKIRVEYFRAHFVVCPRDGSALRVSEIHYDETVTPDLDVSCPLCGLSERIPAPS